MNSLRDQLVEVGLWPALDRRDPTWDIALAWRIVEYIAISKPELYAAFVRELPSGLIFAMYARFAAVNICRAALIASTGEEPRGMGSS
jgi:hypothetical protein